MSQAGEGPVWEGDSMYKVGQFHGTESKGSPKDLTQSAGSGT
jgi:hypothetical protein